MKQFAFPRSRIMLPEHKTAISQQTEIPHVKKELDEQKLHEFQLCLEESLQNGTVLQIASKKKETLHHTIGIILKANLETGCIKVKTLEEIREIKISEILDMQLI